MRTQKEIDKEIKALEASMKYVPQRTGFGDDNIRNITLQIEYLRGEIDLDMPASEWEELSDDEQSAILEAQNWENGDEEESPSSGWDNYRPKRKHPRTKG